MDEQPWNQPDSPQPVPEDSTPKLYAELASWWPLLSAPADYAEEAASLRQVLIQASGNPPHTVLELGSGGGNNASHLKPSFQMTLVDASPGMLAVSQVLNPQCEHIIGDMRTVRLNREFDAVFIHDAICYMTSEKDLRQAIATAYVHCRQGGASLFVPDYVRETFHPATIHGGHDGTHRSLRYLQWVYDPNDQDTTYVVDFAYLLMEGGSVRAEHDRHICGLFSRGMWVQLLEDVGFGVQVVKDPYGRELFVGIKQDNPTR